MTQSAALNESFTWLKPEHLTGMRRGIERETLRMQSNGFLAQTPHPKSLGSALTHSVITTDFSEALLEMITPPLPTPQAALKFLRETHAVVVQNLPKGETLWSMSMPCMLDKDEQAIPLAQYGNSNIGHLKTLYRHGLGLRYGRRMQTIAGLHYNISFPASLFQAWQHASTDPQIIHQFPQDFRDARYLHLIRQMLRWTPLIVYLLGASPAVCGCFLTGRTHDLQPMIGGTLHLPYATTLRMGKYGYQNSTQRQLGIHYNQLSDYVTALQRATLTSYAPFAALGVDDANGQPVQINDHILQIENEFYSSIRPKQITQSGETPSAALSQRGIEYVELRAIDIDPYSDIGIRLDTACFLEVMTLAALLSEQAPLLPAEEARLAENQTRIVEQGRKPDVMIAGDQGDIRFEEWATAQLARMTQAAHLLDDAYTGSAYRDALDVMKSRVMQPNTTPSALVWHDILEAKGLWAFGHEWSVQHVASLLQYPLSIETRARYDAMAEQSLVEQQQLEQLQTLDFKEFLKNYRLQPTSE